MNESNEYPTRQRRSTTAAAWAPAAAVALALFAPPGAGAQRTAADTSLAALVEYVRTNTGNPVRATRVLNQSRGPESPEKLDALADSLVTIVLTAREDAPETYSHALSALAVLNEARTYTGAFDALERIYEGSDDAGVRSVALAIMARRAHLGDPVIPILREAAVSDESSAFAAVQLLAGRRAPDANLGPEGAAVLRQLHEQGLVTQRQARRALEQIARERGWPPG